MAKQTGFIKISGTLDDVTFYRTKDGHLVKMKSRLNKARIANDPKFARTRENGAEFGNAAKSGKLFRANLRPISLNASDSRIVHRVTQLMSKIKNMDAFNIRGERNVGTGIMAPEGKALLKGFEFNEFSELGSILFKPYLLDTLTGEITIDQLKPSSDISFPTGATHVSITGGYAIFDFSMATVDFKMTNVVNLAFAAPSSTITLTPTSLPIGTSLKVYLLRIEFFQFVNGVQYVLKNGDFNALRVIEVV